MQKPQIEDLLPLSPLQHGFLFHALYDKQVQDSYVVQMVVAFEGPLNAAALHQAAKAILQRHANLRAAFVHQKVKEPVQLILRTVELPWDEVDLSAKPAAEREAAYEELLQADQQKRFDLSQAPLLRFTLVRMDRQHYRLIFTHHHILLDGWSMTIFLREFLALYRSSGRDAALARVTPYRDYLRWLESRDKHAALNAWRKALAGVEQPTRVAEVSTSTAAAATQTHLLSAELSTRLVQQGRAVGVTLNTLIQASWAMLIGHLCGRDDVVFGATVSGRPPELPGVEQMLGLLINTVPVRLHLRADESLRQLLTRLQEQQSALLEYQHVSLSEIQQLTGVEHELFDTQVVFENYPAGADDGGDSHDELQISIHSHCGGDTSHYPLSMVVGPGTQIHLGFGYRPDVFSAAQIRRIGERYVRILEAFAGDLEQTAGCLDLLEAAEHQQLREWNATAREVPVLPLPLLFEQQVTRTPHAVAA
ncbi:condensation domain-containing protein, partial [Dyella silvatica]|uniref:condensation domain-containing protein n=1 Tax=Dyella silvatica TaxID=2992128 RepID=UPI00224DC320